MIKSEVNLEPPRLLACETRVEQLELTGLDPALIKAVTKARLGGQAVFVAGLPLGGDVEGEAVYVVFRSLTMSEFDTMASAATLGDVTDLVIETSLVWPTDEGALDDVLPGAYDQLADHVVECSGFESKDAIRGAYNLGRAQSQNIFSAAQMFVMKAMPSMRPQDFAGKDIVTLMRHVAMAEHMLSTEEQPVNFPLREMMGDRRSREKTSRLPNFDELPVYAPHEIASARARNRREYTLEKTKQMRMAQHDPRLAAERRKARIMQKRREIAEKRASEDESRALARRFGRPR